MDMVEAESGVYRYSTTFAGSVVLDAIDATWASAQVRGVTLTPRLGTSDCTITADTSLLTRALVNLLNNAIRCSERGSTIFVCLEADGETEAVISVQDEGVGMDADQIAQVMHTGERRKSSASPFARDAGQGWGVGMAIVHSVVAHHRMDRGDQCTQRRDDFFHRSSAGRGVSSRDGLAGIPAMSDS